MSIAQWRIQRCRQTYSASAENDDNDDECTILSVCTRFCCRTGFCYAVQSRIDPLNEGGIELHQQWQRAEIEHLRTDPMQF